MRLGHIGATNGRACPISAWLVLWERFTIYSRKSVTVSLLDDDRFFTYLFELCLIHVVVVGVKDGCSLMSPVLNPLVDRRRLGADSHCRSRNGGARSKHVSAASFFLYVV